MLMSLDRSNPPGEPLSGPSSKKLKSQASQRKRKSNVMFVEDNKHI